MKRILFLNVVFVVLLGIMLSACGNSDNNDNDEPDDENNNDNTGNLELGQKELSLPYVTWASTIAGVNVVKVVLEDMGYDVDMKEVEAGIMFTGIADGNEDFSVGAVTLPNTHKDYWKEYGDQVDDIGVTMPGGTTLGLAVPDYMDIDSLEDLMDNKNDVGEKVDWTITGIDPGAGEMQLVEEEVMPGYDLDDDWELEASSDTAMTASLKAAMDDEEPIIVTLWEPHWAFIEWDIRYLDDPDGLFGEPDDLHAIARKGFKEDAPAAYKMLSQFEWTPDDMGEVMVDIYDGMDEEDAARKWLDDNQDKVDEWLEGIGADE